MIFNLSCIICYINYLWSIWSFVVCFLIAYFLALAYKYLLSRVLCLVHILQLKNLHFRILSRPINVLVFYILNCLSFSTIWTCLYTLLEMLFFLASFCVGKYWWDFVNGRCGLQRQSMMNPVHQSCTGNASNSCFLYCEVRQRKRVQIMRWRRR